MHRFPHRAALTRRLRTLSNLYGVYEALSWVAAVLGGAAAALAEFFA
ncbi:hypothetical protein [Tropicimonas sp. IMCC34011]|nr:hypothetical protein [Tropicimonas sp. IMCC34011]